MRVSVEPMRLSFRSVFDFKNYLATFFLAVSIAVTRSWGTIGRLPPDPGLDFYVEARRDGLNVLFREEGGYLDVPRRIFSLVVGYFPPDYWVIVSNVIWIGLIGACSVVTHSVVWHLTRSRLVTLLASATYALSPAMSESQLGHDSVVKWSLLLVLALTLRPRQDNQVVSYPRVVVIALCGLSNVVSFSLLPVLLYQQRNGLRNRNFATLVYVTTYLLAFGFQFLIWLQSGQGVQKYASETNYFPWNQMGVFWFFNWLIVPLFALPLLCIEVRRRLPLVSSRPMSPLIQFRAYLLLCSILIWATSYAIGGIADRYFVIPQTLLWIAMITFLSAEHSKPLRITAGRMVSIGVTIAMLLASIKWFAPSQFLTSSPAWLDGVHQARKQCSIENSATVLIPQSFNTVEIECTLLD